MTSFRDSASPAYRVVRAVSRALLRAYYPDLEVEGADRIPDGPLVVAANHPNSLVDPFLISVFLPRKIHWLAKATLFENAVGRWLLGGLGAIPVKRRHEGGDRSSSEALIRTAADNLMEGRAIGIFPEGKSHDAQRLEPLKSGAGRMASLAARDLAASGHPQPVRVLPVILHFGDKARFRSGALVVVGRPFDVHAHEAPETVTESIRIAMEDALVHVEDAEQERLLDAARVLVRRRHATGPAASDPRTVHRVDREVARAIRRFAREEPERLRVFSARLFGYLDNLDAQGFSQHALEPHRLPSHHLGLAMLLLPVAIFGVLHSWVPYRITRWLGLAQSRATDRTMIAMCSLLTGAVLFPLAWLLEAWWIGHRAGLAAGITFLVLAPPTALVARWTFHVLRRQATRAIDVLLVGKHGRAVKRLESERAWLWSEIERWQKMLADEAAADADATHLRAARPEA